MNDEWADITINQNANAMVRNGYDDINASSNSDQGLRVMPGQAP